MNLLTGLRSVQDFHHSFPTSPNHPTNDFHASPVLSTFDYLSNLKIRIDFQASSSSRESSAMTKRPQELTDITLQSPKAA
jgi:hypothetical protein